MPQIVVRELAVMREATWVFETSAPTWTHGPFGGRTAFDPFPAYAHDLAEVRQTAAAVQEKFRPLWDVDLYIADREEVARSNAHSNATQEGHYAGEEWVRDEPVGLILLSGKRTPPHPATTRYLVAHEYGHNVQYMLNHARDDDLYGEALLREYAQVRGLPETSLHHGTGGRWHDSVREVFACDFRILVCGVEAEFWPHPGVPRPEEVAGLGRWWDEARASIPGEVER